MNITRRRFLKASAIAAAPLILSADSPSKKYRTALLGSGWNPGYFREPK